MPIQRMGKKVEIWFGHVFRQTERERQHSISVKPETVSLIEGAHEECAYEAKGVSNLCMHGVCGRVAFARK